MSEEGNGDVGRTSREMHKITCADCGDDAEVPFKPVGNRPVYCEDCYQKHRQPSWH